MTATWQLFWNTPCHDFMIDTLVTWIKKKLRKTQLQKLPLLKTRIRIRHSAILRIAIWQTSSYFETRLVMISWLTPWWLKRRRRKTQLQKCLFVKSDTTPYYTTHHRYRISGFAQIELNLTRFTQLNWWWSSLCRKCSSRPGYFTDNNCYSTLFFVFFSYVLIIHFGSYLRRHANAIVFYYGHLTTNLKHPHGNQHSQRKEWPDLVFIFFWLSQPSPRRRRDVYPIHFIFSFIAS